MNDEYNSNGLGCGWWMLAGALCVLFAAMMLPGDGKSGSGSGNATNSRTGTLSGNQVEVMSRNQLNLWSDVQNCNGDWSCVTVISTTTNTTQNTTTDTRTTVNGDRNVVIGSNGDRLCEGDDGIYRLCEGGQ